jgi:hypothetical protein
MGTWGNGVWQDDVSVDLVLQFEQFLTQGGAPEEAVQELLLGPPWGWGDQDGDAVQILALSALALQHGALRSDLRERPLR